ncbi:hypothetical protein F5146DRAFT_1122714 [Armillaria mellea]|nr:hypothetical protein F5146DRAFT_1122714 [Armillaria mellea]
MSGVYLLLNDSDPLISYGGQWNVEPSSYGNSHCLEAGEDGRISVIFNGTLIAFAGSAPDAPFQVSIDGKMPEDPPNPDENYYGRWYQSPELADGHHTVELSGLASGTQLDYVLVEAGPSTPLADSSIIVDDSNSTEIWYSPGSPGWETISNHSVDDVLYSPFGGSMTASTAEGNMFAFKFAGTAVYVYGIHKFIQVGTVAVTFSVDGSTPSFVAPQEDFEDPPHYLYFTKDRLGPGAHTLVCNVTNVTGDQSFVLDYIVYTPSFESLSDKPAFYPKPQASASPPSPNHHPNHRNSGSGIPAGAIAGLVAGLVVFSAIVVTLTVIWWRGKKQRRVTLSRSSSFGDATVASGGLSPPESSIYDTEVRTPLVPNRFDPNLFVSNSVRSEKHASSRRQLSLSSRFGIGWGYSKRTSSYPEKF